MCDLCVCVCVGWGCVGGWEGVTYITNLYIVRVMRVGCVFHPTWEFLAHMETTAGANGLWTGRNHYHATLAVTWDLNFCGLIWRTAPLFTLLDPKQYITEWFLLFYVHLSVKWWFPTIKKGTNGLTPTGRILCQHAWNKML